GVGATAMHASAVGVGNSCAHRASPTEPSTPLLLTLRGLPFLLNSIFVVGLSTAPMSASDFVGVGHQPNPVAEVRGANGGSRYAVPLRIIPDLGQVPENPSKPSAPFSAKQICDVFHDREGGS